MSKAALNALTRLTAAELGPDDVKVNAMCPGWVKTDMGGPNATRTVEKGAETAVWLATLPEDGPTAASSATASRFPGEPALGSGAPQLLEPAHQIADHQGDVGGDRQPEFLVRQVARHADEAELGDECQESERQRHEEDRQCSVG